MNVHSLRRHDPHQVQRVILTVFLLLTTAKNTDP